MVPVILRRGFWYCVILVCVKVALVILRRGSWECVISAQVFLEFILVLCYFGTHPSIRPSVTGICWSYQQRSKRLLPFNSFHSKIVKDSVVKSAQRCSLTKSCEHLCAASLSFQLERLHATGYPPTKVNKIAKRLFLSSRAQVAAVRSSNNPVVSIPYYHGFAHSQESSGVLSHRSSLPLPI